MLSGSNKFRGISYKVGFGYFAEKQWNRAIKEFEEMIRLMRWL
jgi:hypothetical protein